MTARVFIDVYGCSANQADAEIASGLLSRAGYTLVNDESKADVSVVLTCVVKAPTEQKMVKKLRELARGGKPLVVAGCMAKALVDRVNEIVPNACIVGPDDLSELEKAVDESINGLKGVHLSGSSMDRTCLPRVRRNNVIHIAPISSGCLGNCSYCIVKVARGRLRSFPAERIVSDAQDAIDEGCREIWVTAEDTAAYDYQGIKLPELLTRLSGIEGDFRIRVGMMTPNSAMPIIYSLLKALQRPKVFSFLHIPVQSGNDTILQRMNRRYTVSNFLDVVERFRRNVDGISIATDIICGFPGETEGQYEESLSLVQNLAPDVLNISRFWPRPGTEAERLEGHLPGGVTKDRSRRMAELWNKVSEVLNRRWVGWEGEILLDERGYNETTVGRNQSYKAVAIKGNYWLGDFVKVRITESARGYLIGEKI